MNITIRCAEGRAAFLDPQCKQPIPRDRWITVPETPHLRRLIDVHQDVEERRSAPALAELAKPVEAVEADESAEAVNNIAKIQAAHRAAK